MATAKKLLSAEEFLAWEKAQTERYEYVAGSIYAMAGMSDEHNQLSTNLVTACAAHLTSPCRVRAEGLKVQIRATFLYPDAMILCSPPLFFNARRDTILNPTVIFEALSESTEAFDRGEKFRRYRSLPGLKAIIFVSQDRVLVECWSRKEDAWQVQEWETLSEIMEIEALGLQVPLAQIYEGLEFLDLIQ